MDEPRRPSHAPWALALAAVAIVAIVVAGAVYVFHSVRTLPVDVLEGGRQALRDLREVAAAFRTGTVTTTFRGYATEVSGTSRLQFAELRQEESFERRDSEAVLWGTLALPDVVVEARAPVTYTYFLDLDKEWRFRLEGRDVLVVVPPVEWNRPAVDVSALRFEVREGSVLRDEQVVLDRLRGELTPLLDRRARQHVAAGPRGRAAQGRGLRRDLAGRSASPTGGAIAPAWCSATSRASRRRDPGPPVADRLTALPSPTGLRAPAPTPLCPREPRRRGCCGRPSASPPAP